MFELLAALAVTAAATEGRIPPSPVSVPAVAVRSLEAVPNVTIHYYEVAGSDLTAINASVAAQAPRDPVSNAVSVSSSDWSINVGFAQRIVDGKCTVSGASARFTASVVMPRLLNQQALTREESKIWDQYLAILKSNAAAELWFVNDRVGRIEKAILASSCESASRAASAAADRISQELTRFARINKKPAPTFKVPVRDAHDPRS